MIKFYFPSLFSLTYCILFPLSYNFDKKIAANLYVRLNHSIGCILKLVPILYNHQLVLMDPIQKIVMPLEVKNLFDRSISFFIWDCMALLISDEKDKLFYMGHHLISTLSIGFTRYFEYDWYLICVALFIGEITNPLTQVSEFYILVEKENITFEKFYLQIRYCKKPSLLFFLLFYHITTTPKTFPRMLRLFFSISPLLMPILVF